jgi:hypothetical protein
LEQVAGVVLGMPVGVTKEAEVVAVGILFLEFFKLMI